MSDSRRGSSTESLINEARHLVSESEKAGLELRLTGGLAIYITCTSAQHGIFARDYHDLDFVGLSAQSMALVELFRGLEYLEPGLFNTLNRARRLRFVNPETGHDIDIFLDRMTMCHELDLADRLTMRAETLSPADLLLSKLQIVELNDKDIVDILCLLADHPVTEDESGISLLRFRQTLGSDWGFWKTVTMNLERLLATDLQISESQRASAGQRIDVLLRAAEEMPKTTAWKLRAMVGERVRWYELPEEAG
jgi:hypothetical protein